MENLTNSIKNKWLTVIITVLFFNISNAQYGVSSASVSHTVSNGLSSSNGNGFLNANTIIVEDFMNYHKHHIKIPTKNEVALSIDYDNKILKSNDTFLLQVGLATQNIINREKSNKVNVSLVIDNSGSMSRGKLDKVKTALKVFVKGLKDDDVISIIKFDGDANIVLKASKIREIKQNLNQLIDGVYPEGSTNIHAGMMLGYAEAQKFNTKDYNSKVILLTDGMTNSGITDPEIILRDSKIYNDKNIDISTIGVGQQLDFDLLRQIANNGNGSNYFIGENEMDIQKTFKDELESLLYNIGKNPKLIITLPEGMKIRKFYGYEPKFISENKVQIDIENLDCGQTQIFLLEVEKNDARNTTIHTSLIYEKDNEMKTLNYKTKYQTTEYNTELEVKKNFQIAKMASELKEIAKNYEKNDRNSSQAKIQNILDYYNNFCDKKDEDLKRIYEIALQYSPKKYPNYYN